MSWWVAATATGGMVNLALTAVAWRYREQPGGRWFLGMAGLMTLSAAVYTLALTVQQSFVRHTLEAVFWAATFQIGLCWVAFALAYTGRGSLLRSPLGTIGGVGSVVGVVAILLDPIHGLLFGEITVVGDNAAGIAFTPQPGLFALVGVLAVSNGAAWLLLFDTLTESELLFRRQTAALTLTPLFPMAAGVAFVAGRGPATGVSLVALSYAPHAALDLYALYSGDLFEVDPATRRLGRRAALESVEVPILTVDTVGRVVAANDTANDLFGDASLGSRLDDHLPEPIDPTDNPTRLTIERDDRSQTFRVRTAPFAERGETLGYTVALQNVTDALTRERRLSVLNRVLRHNLRNDLNVVVGHADLLADRVDEEGQRSVETIIRRSEQLLSAGERARELDRVVDGADRQDRVPVASLLETVRERVLGDHPDADVEIAVPAGLELLTDREVCRIVFRNLVANGVEHADDDAPRVTVQLVDVPDTADEPAVAGFAVTDDGPVIPDEEVDVLNADAESALDHGSGLGLWVVQTGVAALGGDVSFDGSPDGTTVTLHVPAVVETAQPIGDPAADAR